MIFIRTPTTTARKRPDIFNEIPDTLSVIPPMLEKPSPNTKIRPTIVKFLECVKLRFDSARDLIPTAAIIPNSIISTPPLTGEGIVCKIAPPFPNSPKMIAKIAVILRIEGL